jgi:CDP-glucose 4,6-dehydratase
MGTVNVLDAVRRCNTIRAVVNVTSDKCYENKGSIEPFNENDPMGGYDPYSNSKGCAELVSHAFSNSYFNFNNYSEHGVALASARAGNVIGGGDWAKDRLVPDIFRFIENRQPIIIRSPNSIRPWQHVLEPLSGYLTLAQNLYQRGHEFVGGWNFGPVEQDAKAVHWIVDKICQDWGEDATWQSTVGEHPHEAILLRLDSRKAKSLLNWHPFWGLEVALEKTILWQQAFQRGENMRDVTLDQITNFREL